MLTELLINVIVHGLNMQKLAGFNTPRALGYGIMAAVIAKLMGASGWVTGAAGAAGATAGGLLVLPGVNDILGFPDFQLAKDYKQNMKPAIAKDLPPKKSLYDPINRLADINAVIASQPRMLAVARALNAAGRLLAQLRANTLSRLRALLIDYGMSPRYADYVISMPALKRLKAVHNYTTGSWQAVKRVFRRMRTPDPNLIVPATEDTGLPGAARYVQRPVADQLYGKLN